MIKKSVVDFEIEAGSVDGDGRVQGGGEYHMIYNNLYEIYYYIIV